MRKVFLVFLLAPLLLTVGCKKKPTLTEEEAQLVQVMIALQKVKAEATDSTTFNMKRDSIFKKYNTSMDAFIKASEELGDNHIHSMMAYDAIKDSLKIK